MNLFTLTTYLLKSQIWRLQRASLGLLLGMVLCHSGLAQGKLAVDAGSTVEFPEIRAQLVAHAPQGLGSGKLLKLGLLLEHQPQWHSYWINPGDSGLATELHWTLPQGARAGPIEWPVPKKLAIGQLANLGYEGKVLLPVQVDWPKGYAHQGETFEVRLHASWLVCRQECIPQEGDFSLKLPVSSSTALHGALFDSAQAHRPLSFAGRMRTHLDGNALVLNLSGLPATWRGKAISAFPEMPSVFATPLLPAQEDPLSASKATDSASLLPATQVWEGDNWSARLALSPQRASSPDNLDLLLVLGEQSLRASAPIEGAWPAPGPGATASPELGELMPAISTNQSELSYWGALLAAFVGGLLLNLMPCVFPILAIKALGLTNTVSTKAGRRVQALAYTGGVLVSMLALGGVLLVLRAGGQELGWGFHLQSPAVIVFLTVLFTLICLNLMDLFHLSVPVPSNLAGMHLSHPARDAALSGVLAVVVASPCTAPFMGASIGLAVSLPAWQAMGIFLALGLGLALPFALVSNSAALAQRLPRPGPWMEQLRRFMVFPMAATVVWLLWVMAHLVGADGAAALALLLLCMALCVWAWSLKGRGRLIFGAIALAVSLFTAMIAGRATLATFSPSPNPVVGASVWRDWSVAAVNDAHKQGRPVFIDFTAAWCITCQYNKQNVLSKAEVLTAFEAKNVLLLRADWTRKDAAISQALQQLGRNGVPVYVLHRPGQAPALMSELLDTDELLRSIAAL